MLLSTAVGLTFLGLAVWVVGLLFGYKGVATLGAVVAVGVGVTIMSGDGLERRAGTVKEEVSQNETVVSVQTTDIELISSFNAGLIWALLGGVMTLQALNREDSIL